MLTVAQRNVEASKLPFFYFVSIWPLSLKHIVYDRNACVNVGKVMAVMTSAQHLPIIQYFHRTGFEFVLNIK